MAVRVAYDEGDRVAVLYDSTSGWAFGPVMGSEDEADEFLEFVARTSNFDVRGLTHESLAAFWRAFVESRDAEGERQDEAKARDW